MYEVVCPCKGHTDNVGHTISIEARGGGEVEASAEQTLSPLQPNKHPALELPIKLCGLSYACLVKLHATYMSVFVLGGKF